MGPPLGPLGEFVAPRAPLGPLGPIPDQIRRPLGPQAPWAQDLKALWVPRPLGPRPFRPFGSLGPLAWPGVKSTMVPWLMAVQHG